MVNELVLKNLNIYKSLNEASILNVLAGKTEVLTGLALEVTKEALKSIEMGLAQWGEGYPEQKKRQELKRRIFLNAIEVSGNE